MGVTRGPPGIYRVPSRKGRHDVSDRQTTTRDLAETSRTDESDATAETEHAVSDPETEATRADERSTRGQSDGEAADADPRLTRRDDTGDQEERGSLLPDEQTERFTNRWHEIQASFVDEPRESVAEADALVADLMQRLAASFSNEREQLESQWDRGDDVSTEDLRVALTRYRSFFDRLLSA
jgi:hypothetical protein